MNRFFKQFFYGLFYLCVIAAIAEGVYYFNFIRQKEASCFDNIKNQKETAVDCGGECVDCELLTIALQIDEPRVFPSGNLKSTVLTKVSNHSLNYGLNNFEYEFQISNNFGALLAKPQGSSYILPNEERYLLAPALDIDARDIGKVVLNIPRENWELKSKLPIYRFALEDIKTTSFTKTVQVSGNFVNDSSDSYSSVSLVGIIFNKSGAILTVSSAKLDNVTAFSEIPFMIFFPDFKSVAEIDFNATKVFYEVKR